MIKIRVVRLIKGLNDVFSPFIFLFVLNNSCVAFTACITKNS